MSKTTISAAPKPPASITLPPIANTLLNGIVNLTKKAKAPGASPKPNLVLTAIYDFIKQNVPWFDLANASKELPSAILHILSKPAVFDTLLVMVINAQGLGYKAEDLYPKGAEGLQYYFKKLGFGGETIASGAYQDVFANTARTKEALNKLPKKSPEYYSNQMNSIITEVNSKRMDMRTAKTRFDALYKELEADTNGMRPK